MTSMRSLRGRGASSMDGKDATHVADDPRRPYVVLPPPVDTKGSCRNVHVRPILDLPKGWNWEDIPPPPGEEYVQLEREKTPSKKKPTVVIEAKPVAAPEVHVDEDVKKFVPAALQRRKTGQQTMDKNKKKTQASRTTQSNQPQQEEVPDPEYASFVEDLKNIGAYD